MNLINIKDNLEDDFKLNPKINIILLIFSLSKLLMRHNIYIKIRNISNVFQLKQLLTYKNINLNLNLAIAFHIKIAIANKNKINLIKFLKHDLIKTAKVIININEEAAI